MKSLTTLVLAVTVCVLSVPASAQLIKYITYYPVPAVTHSQIEVKDKAVLGAVDGGVIEFGSDSVDASGAVVGEFFNANRVEITSFTHSGGSPDLVVGSVNSPNTNASGALKSGANLTLEEWPNPSQLEATGALSIHSIQWTGKGGFGKDKDGIDTWQGCPQTGPDGEPAKLSWVQLKVVGSDEYRTYLICGGLAQTAEPECNLKCTLPMVVKGSPVRQNCRCVEDCSKRTDGRNVEISGICCKKGQIVKETNVGKYCTFPFREQYVNVNAIAKTNCSPSGNSCNNATTCNVDMTTLKYYYGGNVRVTGQDGETYRCGTSGKLCKSWKRSKNNKAYNKPHQDGWSGGTLLPVCPTVSGTQSICDSFCDNDNENCRSTQSARYCYKKDKQPSLPKGTKYRYSTCYTKNKSGCDEPVWTYGSKDSGYKCGDAYTAYAQVVYCSK